MSSIKPVVRLNRCVLEKLIPFKPIKLQGTQCRIHPLRANCKVIKHYDETTDTTIDNHVTILDAIYQNYDRQPYYMCLVNSENDLEIRGVYVNANEMFAYVMLQELDDDEKFFGIDEAGEKNMSTIRTVIKTIIDAFQVCQDKFILMIDELQIDVIYSIFRCIVLPQRMYHLYNNENEPIKDGLRVFSVPFSDEAFQSQVIYRTFLIYNTVLTMLLQQSNPFNDNKKNISVIFRTLGKCPNNKERVKCCDLRYGGNAPGHVMCPPREMVKRIFHYAKWARNPTNYSRYFQLIVTPPVTNRVYDANTPAAINSSNNLVVMDWYNFIDDFRTYFGIVLA
ncbi:vp1054 [Mamestra brassicae multiple nucleopolyhedrovirus]|uniref:Vp1054 n=1 Tax=Mamestra brassicae nuclear polyhedrosis virus TaxID=78219 RepID=I3XME1_NPVMB|nr:vp1054 [Mamestra brassicae multiple nucleopolyhedrovirus]AFL64974.1 vp1054 [Mamestra brassicae multiple nucleopolyhedrovirus]WRQ96697.1 vp1054 [Mamestra configurata nucleopolyhedrovirus B]WRQ96858.1 vp1054 [Mamestra configurata nucleopolyhedrovirus B]WRQ97019.1 vp1054 [Mamestra configurata nucleopolyhedrovirus B]